MKSSAVKPGYSTMAICMITPLSEGFAVLVRRDADSTNEVAAHAFCGPEAAARGDGSDGVVGFLELATRGFGADSFDVGARRLADLRGEHPREMPWAHVDSAGQFGDAVYAARFGLDGLLDVTDGLTLGAGHPHGRGELRLSPGPAQVEHQPAGHGLRDVGAVVVF